MASLRVIEYFHTPGLHPEFIDFVLRKSRLRGIDLEIAKNYLADNELDTAGYAQLVHMDKHRFSRHSGNVFRAIVRVLLQLAQEAWEAQYKSA